MVNPVSVFELSIHESPMLLIDVAVARKPEGAVGGSGGGGGGGGSSSSVVASATFDQSELKPVSASNARTR